MRHSGHSLFSLLRSLRARDVSPAVFCATSVSLIGQSILITRQTFSRVHKLFRVSNEFYPTYLTNCPVAESYYLRLESNEKTRIFIFPVTYRASYDSKHNQMKFRDNNESLIDVQTITTDWLCEGSLVYSRSFRCDRAHKK